MAQNNGGWSARYFTIWGGQTLSRLGSSGAGFALVWWMTELTGSATVLAGAALAAMLPLVLVAPLAGTLVDRWNRRATMIFADLGVAATMAGLAALASAGALQVWHVIAANFLISVAGSFQGFALMASTTLLVPERHFTRIQGANQIGFCLQIIKIEKIPQRKSWLKDELMV